MNTPPSPPGVPGADSRKKLTRCADLPTHRMNAPVRMGDAVGDEPSLHADDIILLTTSQAELQELVDRLDPSQPQIGAYTHQRRQDQCNG